MYLGGSRNETELRIDLFNGSRIQIFGADNPDSIRGMGFDGVVLDEYAIMSTRVWTEIIRPAIADKLGWVLFIGTPMGHNQFWEVYDYALRGHKDWYGKLYKSSDTKVIPDEELEQARSIMTPEQYDQEFECSFQAAITGSYYGALIEGLEAQSRVTEVPCDDNLDVETWWDLGLNDSTAIWFVQKYKGEIRLIDYYENAGYGLDHYVSILDQKGYDYSKHIAPHDIKVREIGNFGKSRLESALELGIAFEVAPKLSIEDGIEAVRKALPNCWFDKNICS